MCSGPAHVSRYFLTAERFTAVRAKEIGLLHEVVETQEELENAAAALRYTRPTLLHPSRLFSCPCSFLTSNIVRC